METTKKSLTNKIFMKNYLLSTLIILFALTAKSQSIVYKSEQWGNTKLYKSWTTALDNPVLESVKIVQTDKTITATFGKRVLKYTIINSEKLGSYTTKFKVTMNEKIYLIKLHFNSGKYTFICDNEWAVAQITDMSSK